MAGANVAAVGKCNVIEKTTAVRFFGRLELVDEACEQRAVGQITFL